MLALLLTPFLLSPVDCGTLPQVQREETLTPLGYATSDASGILDRPVVLGASMSVGFGTVSGTGFAKVLAETFGKGELPARASEYFFLRPFQMGSDGIDFAQDEEATLVIAVDYLFWFGYGHYNAQGDPLASEEERLELLEVGLDNLDQLDCAIVVGDFPDMSAAVGIMLNESQMPALETLPKLNARVQAWAHERRNTIVVPLGEFVHSLNSDQPFEAGRYSLAAGSRKRLIQDDQLHPTLAGLCLLAHVVADELVRAELVEEDRVTLDLPTLLGAFDLEAKGLEPRPEQAVEGKKEP